MLYTRSLDTFYYNQNIQGMHKPMPVLHTVLLLKLHTNKKKEDKPIHLYRQTK